MSTRGTRKPGSYQSVRAGGRLAWNSVERRPVHKVPLPAEVTVHLVLTVRNSWGDTGRLSQGPAICGARYHTVVASSRSISDATCQECLVVLDELLEAGLLVADGAGVREV